MSAGSVAGSRAHPSLAVAVVLAWAVGASTSAVVGLWPALGVTAVALGAVAVGRDAGTRAALLRWSGSGIAAGLITGALMTVATYALYPVARGASGAVAPDATQLYAKLGAASHGWLALVLVPVVVGEEAVWRGLVHGALARRFASRSVVVASGALLYALAHAPVRSPLLVVVALGCGIVWGGLRALTGSLVAPLIAHLLWDQIVLFVRPLAG